MNAQVAACRTGEARFQAILDRFGYDTPRGSAGDLPAVRGARARDGVGDPGRHLQRRGLSRRRRARPRPDPGQAQDRRRGRPDDRPRGSSSRWGRQLRLRPDRVGVPRRLQAAHQPRAAGRRRRVQDAGGQGADPARSSTPRAGRLPVVLQLARPADRSRRDGALSGAAGQGRGRALRRLDGCVPRGP